MNSKAAAFLNTRITAQILVKGQVSWLVDHLRHGDAPHITQETWCIVADYLEGKHRKPGRPEEDHRDRDRAIADAFFKMRLGKVKQKDAYQELADQFGIGVDGVAGIVNAARRKKKRILELWKGIHVADENS